MEATPEKEKGQMKVLRTVGMFFDERKHGDIFLYTICVFALLLLGAGLTINTALFHRRFEEMERRLDSAELGLDSLEKSHQDLREILTAIFGAAMREELRRRDEGRYQPDDEQQEFGDTLEVIDAGDPI